MRISKHTEKTAPSAVGVNSALYQPSTNSSNNSHFNAFHELYNISVLPSNGKTVQTKTAGPGQDSKYEKEADKVADAVTGSMPSRSGSEFTGASKLGTANHQQSSVEQGQGGRTLNRQTNTLMSRQFGVDFGNVRIHTGDNATRLNNDMNARAFTVGSNIYFNKSEYNPDSTEGKKLIAHELTHVVQQSKSGVRQIQRKCKEPPPGKDEKLFVYQRKGKSYAAKFKDENGALAFIKKYPDLDLSCYKMKDTYDVYIKEKAKPDDKPEDQPPEKEAPKKDPEAPQKDPEAPKKSPEVPKEEKKDDAGPPEKKEAAPPPEITYALTFDDGPHVAELGKGINRTENVLDVLKSNGIKGGFFIQTGVSFRGAHKTGIQLVQRMNKEGHTVGIHTGGTKDHELHTKAQKAGRLEGELENAKTYVKDKTGVDATFVRPPTGATDKDVLKTYAKVGLTNLMWDIDGDNGKSLPLNDLNKRLESEMAKVSARNWKPSTAIPKIVVLYHDIQKSTSENIDKLIQKIKELTTKLTGGKSKAKFDKP